ncbi:acyl-CoA dehydrogenase family protein [Rhodobacter sp. KR11]|uniref:acyl-CoA dehydrogenase family protein n=1 Tax=Rhodobacter sp. KR11 TaxID=2974588 RepID=UPI002223D82D|nr:acyl-CoA dehydrogenase family protein [Rhodobacter sp. KR11]MCW1919273.1 acyl-CoA dehydrogenase family protein [Rhodobacter sp. KR11]
MADGQDLSTSFLPDLLSLTAPALGEAQAFLSLAKAALAARVVVAGRIDSASLEADQTEAHGLAWIATYVQALTELDAWARAQTLGEAEALVIQIGFGEYLAQLQGGIPMSQGEFARGCCGVTYAPGPQARALIAAANDAAKARLVALLCDGAVIASGLDEDLEMIRAQFRRFAEEEVIPQAQGWHLRDDLIPMEIIQKLADMGVFGLTIPEEHGGFGLSKAAMVVVSEELSRGYIGVGSLGTRTEIAAELILCGGTPEQKAQWLPKLASAEILPTAVFTEPNTGSDLGALRTRAVLTGDTWHVTGNKTWITHAARAHVMMLMTRTGTEADWRGLSLLIAEKTPGSDADPFPTPGMKGSEIKVLGYRGMKEYELSFDNFAVPAANLLGGVTGQGFKQLMQTFESARIQTAARAIGVAQAALDCALRYAMDRVQFGKPLVDFPRVSGKLAMMAVEIAISRQITYHAARAKDEGRRCDLEAGMAKLLAARVAWAAADNGVQIHGGNGFACEYLASRLLVDARILSIFEGAAEIQANVIARRLLE